MKYLANITLITAMGVMAYMMTMMLYPFKLIEYTQPFHIITPVVKAGKTLKFENDYCKHTDTIAVLHRSLIGDSVYPLPNTISNLPEGCGKVIINVDIPDYVPSGTYRLKTTTEWQINILRTVVNTAQTEEFQVVGKEPSI